MCVPISGFLLRSRLCLGPSDRIIRGGQFTISADYRAYEPLKLKFVCCAFVIPR